jgi:hypothetical protein
MLVFALCSCKNITKTCHCDDPWGKTVYAESSVTKSKKDSQAFVDDCRAKTTTWHTTSGSGSNAVTTTTVVPCKIID